MDALFLRLSELPFYLDIVAFWAMVFSFGFGTAYGVKLLSEALERTDRLTRRQPAADAAPAEHKTLVIETGAMPEPASNDIAPHKRAA